jgi:hypothetical protein
MSELDGKSWGGWTRTTNFRINSPAVCQLTYTPNTFGPTSDVTPQPSHPCWAAAACFHPESARWE